MIDLLSHNPHTKPEELTSFLQPGHRFRHARFETYRPNSQFPSQQRACELIQQFIQSVTPKKRFRLFSKSKNNGHGLYIDGGFGVGKTHLLASAYYAAKEQGRQVALMSFQDLMFLIGLLGMGHAVETLKDFELLLIDEFELDDPGNTHMANTLLGQLMPAGTHVIATSNTEPGALGTGRFNAEDFQRQIQGIAKRFETHAIDGPDYRQRQSTPTKPLSQEELTTWLTKQDETHTAIISHRKLNRRLLEVHPSQFARLLEGVTVAITDLIHMPEQGLALRFVHCIDKIYDLGEPAAFTGVPLTQLFDETYRHGGYAKKYSRSLSRLTELLQETRQLIQ